MLENVTRARKRKLYIEEEERELFESFRKMSWMWTRCYFQQLSFSVSESTEKPWKPRGSNKARNKTWW